MADNGLNIDDLQIKIGIEASTAASGLKELAKGLRSTASECSQAATSLSRIAKVAKDTGTTMTEAADTTEKIGASAEKAKISLFAMAKEFLGIGQAAKKSNNGMGSFLSAVKRIATYRAIRAVIKAVVNALKEGLDMFVTWDRDMNGSMAGAARAVDTLKEAVGGLKASLGALLGGIITQIEPFITRIINGLTQLVDVIQMISRALQGQGTYYKAVYKGAKAAAGSAKELQRVLFGFDELNVLPSKNGSGSSAGGGEWGYELQDSDSWIQSMKKTLEQNYSDKPLLKIIMAGAMTAQHLFEWIGETFIKPVVNWFKTTVKPWIEGAIQNIWDGIVNFFTSTIPSAIASVGNWFKTGAENAWNWVVGVWSNFKGWLTDTATNAWNGVIGIWDNIKTWVSNTATNAWQSIVDVWGNFKNWINEKIVSPITNAWSTIKEKVFAPLAQKWEEVKQGAVNAWEGIKKPFVQAKEWFSETFGEAWRKVKGIFSGDSDVIQGIKDGLSNAFKTVVNKLITGLNSVIAKPFNALNSILRKIKDVEIFSWKPFQNIVASVSVPQIPYLAGGGLVPNTGSLFYAGEAGAEVVANMGHSTGVMNVGQMQEAVANGNIEVVNAVYAMANAIVGAVNGKNFDIYMDSQKVGKSVTLYQQAQARRLGVNGI